MTRENLIQAIYDNEENWSCAYSCPHTMEEENPKDVCWKCAESLLSEYEQKIRAEVIEEVTQKVEFEEKWLFDCYMDNGCKYSSKDINIAFGGIKHFLQKLKEQK